MAFGLSLLRRPSRFDPSLPASVRAAELRVEILEALPVSIRETKALDGEIRLVSGLEPARRLARIRADGRVAVVTVGGGPSLLERAADRIQKMALPADAQPRTLIEIPPATPVKIVLRANGAVSVGDLGGRLKVDADGEGSVEAGGVAALDVFIGPRPEGAPRGRTAQVVADRVGGWVRINIPGEGYVGVRKRVGGRAEIDLSNHTLPYHLDHVRSAHVSLRQVEGGHEGAAKRWNYRVVELPSGRHARDISASAVSGAL